MARELELLNCTRVNKVRQIKGDNMELKDLVLNFTLIQSVEICDLFNSESFRLIFIMSATKLLTLILHLTILIISISAKATFYPGDCLLLDEHLESTNECFKLIMQKDGNLVLYRKSEQKALWSSKTDLTNSHKFCHSATGVLMIKNHEDRTTFIAGNASVLKGAFAVLQNDGNFVLYAAAPLRPIWATNTFSYC
jgi:hypothetical protein